MRVATRHALVAGAKEAPGVFWEKGGRERSLGVGLEGRGGGGTCGGVGEGEQY